MSGTVEFERFRPLLIRGLGYGDGAKGGRPAFDPVGMFKVLVVQAQHNLSDDDTPEAAPDAGRSRRRRRARPAPIELDL